MKNYAYRESKMKHRLAELRENKVDVVIWKLNPNQREYVERLGYYVEEYLYMITTRPFYGLAKIESNLLKSIHFKNKKGIKTFLTKLTEKEKDSLSKYGVKYMPYKFKIFLYPRQKF